MLDGMFPRVEGDDLHAKVEGYEYSGEGPPACVSLVKLKSRSCRKNPTTFDEEVKFITQLLLCGFGLYFDEADFVRSFYDINS